MAEDATSQRSARPAARAGTLRSTGLAIDAFEAAGDRA
jgi:hypothetical protein